jgi:hypothetical protein
LFTPFASLLQAGIGYGLPSFSAGSEACKES